MSLWIDLTDFLQWKGNLTGIQRIQYNLSKKYIESGDDVHFFVYSESSHNFNEVAFNPDEIVKSGLVHQTAGHSLGNSLVRRVMRKLSKPNQHTRRAAVAMSPFKKDDTVLVMGGIWAGDFIDDLSTEKKRLGFRLIHFAFDMIPSLFPGYVVDWLPEAFSTYQKKVFSVSEGIIAISESTANDVRQFIKSQGITHLPEITVVRIGEEIATGKGEGAVNAVEEIRKNEFILSVSTVEGRKNHAALFYVVKEAARQGIKLPKIVIVGRNGWLTDDIRYMIANDIEASKHIAILNNVDDSQLAWLYENCRFTVFPSFYEGWGMPIAESLAHGKLCLSSNTSSMPEIAGDLIDYFSPYNTGEMLAIIVKYLEPQMLASREKRIKAQYAPTSWYEMHKAVSSFIESLEAL